MAKIKTKYGNSKDRFGHKDLEANLKAGVSYSEILQYLKDNPKKLWSGNAKGKSGGLFELVKSKTKEETAAANKAKAEKAQAEQLKIDEAAKIGGYTRVDPGEYDEGIAFDKDGLAIKTYDGKTLKLVIYQATDMTIALMQILKLLIMMQLSRDTILKHLLKN